MSTEIPPFGGAIKHLRGLLAQSGLPEGGPLTPFVWLTKEDFYEVRSGWYYFNPRPSCTAEMFNDYYEAGRARGIVKVEALFYSPGVIGCTVWSPQSEAEAEAQQGWYSGLKVRVSLPLGIGAEVRSNLEWNLRRLLPKCRRYQSFDWNIPSTAEVRNARSPRAQ